MMRRLHSPKPFSALLLAALLLGGCATTDLDPSKWSAQRFYTEAKESLDNSDYETAIKRFEDLEIHHPFSPYTQQAQLEVAYAYYKFDEPDSAIAAADRYIKLYPRANDVDYAYYLRGLVSFERGLASLDLALGLDVTKREPKSALNAFNYFEELLRRYPESRYGDDARLRMIDLRNRLAAHEIHVAGYYMRRGAPLSAANRAQRVLELYPQTPAVPEALVIMTQAYRKLGIDDLAADTVKVIELNYPDRLSAVKN
jgi:outer membrane protein assembly factor BamD